MDYRDGAGIRRWESYPTREAAQDCLGDVLKDRHQQTHPAVDRRITLREYGGKWLEGMEGVVKRRTLRSYCKTLEYHVYPTLGGAQVQKLQRAQIKALLIDKLTKLRGGDRPKRPLSRSSVRIILATIRGLLNEAIEDRLIRVNPAARLGEKLRLVQPKRIRQEEIKAFARKQLAAFLAGAVTEPTSGRYAPLFHTLAFTGMRLGEGLGLQWHDLDFDQDKIRVSRAFSGGRLEDTPKSGASRTVDMSLQLVETLRRLETERKAEKIRRGWTDLPPWVFVTEAGTPLDESRVRKVFAKVLKKVKLPGHFSPHSLRHSYASILLAEGEDLVYVQEQLGHASIAVTVDTYGRWLPKKGRGGWDRLEEQVVAETAKMVAEAGCGETDAARKVTEIARPKGGGPPRTRTLDPLIKSQLLYQTELAAPCDAPHAHHK